MLAGFIILKAVVEREKAVQAIDVHRECTNCVVTFWVMSQFVHFLGVSRGCADFRDPTAVFRFNKTFAALTTMCSDTKELGYDMLWQGEAKTPNPSHH